MLEAQREFDARAGPLCPEQLAAPELHQVLALPAVQVGRPASRRLAPLPGEPGTPPRSPAYSSSSTPHSTLGRPATPPQEHIWGCKGVGSQGDGTAQFLCRNAGAQQAVCGILSQQLGLLCMPLTVAPPASQPKTSLGGCERVRAALRTAHNGPLCSLAAAAQ
jgi:hypothetical protein